MCRHLKFRLPLIYSTYHLLFMAQMKHLDINVVSFDYDNKLLVETFQESFLLLASKGVCLERLFYKHLQLYSNESVLVLVLNATSADVDYFSHCLVRNGQQKPKYLTSQSSTDERTNLYLQGKC